MIHQTIFLRDDCADAEESAQRPGSGAALKRSGSAVACKPLLGGLSSLGHGLCPIYNSKKQDDEPDRRNG